MKEVQKDSSDTALEVRRHQISILLSELGLSSLKDATDLQSIFQQYQSALEGKDKEISTLQSRISALEEELSRFTSPCKNSRNSHIPPSKNPIGIRHTSSLREKSGLKSGGQPGHKGVTLEMAHQAHDTLAHLPEVCPQCGCSLTQENLEVSEIRQVWDLPVPIEPFITNHVCFKQTCRCGCQCKGEFPSHVNAPLSYGPNVQAAVGYLSTMQHLPFKRLTQAMDFFFGIRMSQGSVQNILQRMRKKSWKGYQLIRHQVETSPVVGADETGVSVNGKRYWVWVFQSEAASYILQDMSRGKGVIDKHFPKGLGNSVLVTDRLLSYFSMNVAHHQVCLAHLLRELKYLAELDPDEDWAVRMLKLLRDSIALKNKGDTPPQQWEPIEEEINRMLQEEIKSGKPEYLSFQKGVRKHKDYLLTFLKHKQVPFDNNASERAIRPVKIKMKVSGGFRTEQGGEAFCQLHSIVQTARKNGLNPFLALKEVALMKEESTQEGVPE